MKKMALIKCVACMYMFAGVLVSCTSELDSLNNTNNDFDLDTGNELCVVSDVKSEMKSDKSGFDLNSLPPMDMNEIRAVLDKLDGLTFTDSEKTNTVVDGNMVSYTLSNSAVVGNGNSIRVSIDMITYTDDNSLYYKNNALSVVGSDMYMVSKGFSLSTGKDSNLYNVSITGAVYFKLVDADGNTSVVSRDINLIGTLDIVNCKTSFV